MSVLRQIADTLLRRTRLNEVNWTKVSPIKSTASFSLGSIANSTWGAKMGAVSSLSSPPVQYEVRLDHFVARLSYVSPIAADDCYSLSCIEKNQVPPATSLGSLTYEQNAGSEHFVVKELFDLVHARALGVDQKLSEFALRLNTPGKLGD